MTEKEKKNLFSPYASHCLARNKRVSLSILCVRSSDTRLRPLPTNSEYVHESRLRFRFSSMKRFRCVHVWPYAIPFVVIKSNRNAWLLGIYRRPQLVKRRTCSRLSMRCAESFLLSIQENAAVTVAVNVQVYETRAGGSNSCME